MLDYAIQAIKDAFNEHGIEHNAIVVGLDQEKTIRDLGGFVDSSQLSDVPTTKYGVVVGRIPGCWLVVWSLVPAGYVYSAEVDKGKVRMRFVS